MYQLIKQLTIAIITVFISLTALSQDTVISNYPKTQQRWEKIYHEGRKTAENIYHSNDNPWMTVRYDSQAAENWLWFHENGNRYFEATILNDLLQGSYKIWYENGQLAEEIFFTDNLENGPATFYYPNGQIAMKGTYEDGKMVGEWEYYNMDGTLPEGAWTWYFAAAKEKVRVKGQFRNGQPEGVWEYWATANQGRINQKRYQRCYTGR